MSVIIPLAPVARAAEAVAAPGGVKIPLRFGQQAAASAAPAVQGEDQVVRAVAAAVALRGPTAAAVAAEQAKDDPGTLVPEVKEGPLTAVVSAVRSVQKGRTKPAEPTDEQRLIAEGIGASAALVAAAHRATEDENALNSARAWVATLDDELLARAARVAVRRGVLLLAEPAAEESRLTSLEKRVAKLEGIVSTLGGTSGSAPSDGGAGGNS